MLTKEGWGLSSAVDPEADAVRRSSLCGSESRKSHSEGMAIDVFFNILVLANKGLI